MKLPQTIVSRIQRMRAEDSATPNEQNSRHWALRRPGKRQAAIGLAALAAAGVVAGTALGLSGGGHGAQGVQDNLNAQPIATVSSGSAPQLHVSGNQLVDSNGQPVVLHGVDRSGTEFMCVQKGTIFDGPVNTAAIDVMKAKGIDVVRVPLNEACWNGDSYVNPAASGANYQNAIKAFVQRLNAAGMNVILDLHWTDGTYTGPASACSSSEAVCQKPMPDQAGAIPFWTSVANTFKGNDSVIFDLFNEPYPDQLYQGNTTEAWNCWLHGGSACPGFSYQVAGMQDLVNAVRSTGANNVLMLGGLTWSNDLDGWLAHEPSDPDHNLAASWHSYNFNACSTESCWNSQIAPVIAKVPLIAGEIGENDCSDTYLTPLMNWLNSKGASYLAWTWNSDFNCATGPGLITSYSGAPTGMGVGVEAMLHNMAHTDPANTVADSK
jgi:endoglucanase